MVGANHTIKARRQVNTYVLLAKRARGVHRRFPTTKGVLLRPLRNGGPLRNKAITRESKRKGKFQQRVHRVEIQGKGNRVVEKIVTRNHGQKHNVRMRNCTIVQQGKGLMLRFPIGERSRSVFFLFLTGVRAQLIFRRKRLLFEGLGLIFRYPSNPFPTFHLLTNVLPFLPHRKEMGLCLFGLFFRL